MGETASRLRLVFDAMAVQRGVYFFDEFDAVAKERGDVHESGEIKRVVNSLLMQTFGLSAPPFNIYSLGGTLFWLFSSIIIRSTPQQLTVEGKIGTQIAWENNGGTITAPGGVAF